MIIQEVIRLCGVVTRESVPQAHKIALYDIPAGGEIIRYGVVLGYAKENIPAGSWINEHMLHLPDSPSLDDMPWGTNLKSKEELPTPPRTTWLGYRNQTGPAGTRNRNKCTHGMYSHPRHHQCDQASQLWRRAYDCGSWMRETNL